MRVKTARRRGNEMAPALAVKNGFTLAEVLVCVALISFIAAGIYEVFIVANRSWHSDSGMVDLQQAARKAMDGMTREIRQSKPSEITLQNNQITFSLPDPDSDEWIGDIKYYLDTNDVNNDNKANQIIREYPVGTYKVLAEDIDSLSLCWLQDSGDCNEQASNVARIQLKAKRTVYGREVCFPAPCADNGKVLEEKVRLRNEDE